MPADALPSTVDGLSDEEVADRLRRRRAYVEVDGATPGRLAFVARAYRHDWIEALRVLDGLGGDPGLRCPVTELALGPAAHRLWADAVTRRHLDDLSGDVARLRPDTVLDVLDRRRGSVASPA